MKPVFLRSIEYVLGERVHDYREAASFGAVTQACGMADMPSVFGWGQYRATTRSIAELAIEAGAATLAASGTPRAEIDAVLICSVNFHQAGDRLYQTVLPALGLSHAYPLGVTLSNCTMLLAGIELARGMVAGGRRNVLVIAANRIEDEGFRFQNYALFSDGAAAMLVSGEGGGFEILGSALAADVRPEVSADGLDDAALYARAQDGLMRHLQMTGADLERVFCNNLFLPVVKIKEGRIGLRQSQLFLGNVARFGHCFAADPLINLADFQRDADLVDGMRFMLTSNADRLRAQTVLRYQK